jgi:hypothetical protein
VPRDKDVNSQSGKNKARDARDISDTHGNGAHADRDDRRQADTGTTSRKPTLQYRLIHKNVAHNGPVDYFLQLGESAFRKLVCARLFQAYVIRFYGRTQGERLGRYHYVTRLGWRRLSLPRTAGELKVEKRRHGQRENQTQAQNDQESSIHSNSST